MKSSEPAAMTVALEPIVGRQTWDCPWEICTHEQAQACRAEMRTSRRTRGCGTYFAADVTPEHAKQIIRHGKMTPNANSPAEPAD